MQCVQYITEWGSRRQLIGNQFALLLVKPRTCVHHVTFVAPMVGII